MFGSQLLIAPKVSLEADNFDATFVTNTEEYINNRQSNEGKVIVLIYFPPSAVWYCYKSGLVIADSTDRIDKI